MDSKIDDLKEFVKSQNAALQTALTAQNAALQTALTAQNAALQAELTAQNAALQADLTAQNAALQTALTAKIEAHALAIDAFGNILADHGKAIRSLDQKFTSDHGRLAKHLMTVNWTIMSALLAAGLAALVAWARTAFGL